MKTITLTSILLLLTVQLTVKGQTQGKQVNNLKADKINFKITVTPQSKNTAKYKILPKLGDQTNTERVVTKESKVINLEDAKLKADELTSQVAVLTDNAMKLKADNKIMQLEIAEIIQNEAYGYQKQSYEIMFLNTISEFNYNKLEFNSLVKSADSFKTLVELCVAKHAEAEYELNLAKEMMQEAYAMPNIAATVGTMSNAEEKEIVALKMQNQAIEQLKTVVLFSVTLKDNLVCVK
ncbi:MAG: hypothetical protein SFY56_10380 [Bacteroidota bacterium]|nr:hypothetical protein [Bacteroidota bacterium]